MKKRNNNDKNSDKQSDKSFPKKDKNKKSSNSKRNSKTCKSDDLIEQPTEFVIPPDNNKLARINISVDDQSITHVELNNNADNITLQDKPLPINEDEYIKETTVVNDVKLTPGTEKIWKYVALGKINMLYAQIGTSMDGRPILDHDLLSTVLVTYGFDIDNAINFINDFAENSKDDNSAPIIMINSHMTDIVEMVEPIENI